MPRFFSQRHLGSHRNRRKLCVEGLENRRVLAAYISELHFAPLFGDSEENQYLELRGDPGAILDDGTYFVGIESADGVGELGDIHTIIDLGGLAFGSNGYMVFLQSVKDPGGAAPPPAGFAVNPAANVLRGTDGFLGLPGSIYEADGNSKSIHAGTSTYFLVQSSVKPTLSDDIDGNDDGLPDGVYNSWTILDGFSTIPWVEGPFDQHSFAQIVFSERGAGDGFLPGSTVVRTVQQAYAGRIGGSIGYEPHEWLTGNTVETDIDTFEFQFQHGTFGTPRPEAYGGLILNNIGGPNWFGSISGAVFEDLDADGVQDPGESPVNGVEIKVQHQNSEETFWETIEPDEFEIDDDISNISRYVTTVTAGSDNVHLGFRNTVAQEPYKQTGQHVFSHAGVNFFNDGRRLRMDFFRPARTVMIDFIGDSDLDEAYGRLEIFNKEGQSLGFVRSNAMRKEERQTISISSPNDDIAWAVAYSDEDFLNSSPFGRLDSLRVEIPYATETVVANGTYSVTPLFDEGYEVSVVNSGDFAQVFPAQNGSRIVGVAQSQHVSDVNFGFKAKQAPQLDDQLFSVGELIGAGEVIGNLPVVPDYFGQPLEFSILSGNEEGKFSIDGSTFDLLAATGDFDFETRTAYTLVVEVTDSSSPALSDTATIQVSITDQNDAPEVAGQQQTLTENAANGTEVAAMQASDQDNATFTWSIEDGNVGGAFAIDPTTGVVSVANSAAVNFEVNPIFDLTVRATDSGIPAKSGEANLRVQLLDEDEIPIVSPKNFQIAENSLPFTHIGLLEVSEPDANETITWRIVGADSQAFSLVPTTGELRVAAGANLDFETQAEYVFLAEATDSAVPPKTGSRSVTITLLDRNDAPEIPNQSISIAENSPEGSDVGTVLASDADANQTLTFEISGGADASRFTIDAATGMLSVAADANLDFEMKSVVEVEVTVTDSNIPPASTSRMLMVQIEDANDAPKITATNLFVEENSAVGTELSVEISDQDAGDTHTFEILSQSLPWLQVSADGSKLEVTEGAEIDFEANSQNTLELKVIDSAGAEDIATLTVSATDANDAPQLVNPLADASVDVGQSFTYTVPADTFSDQDVGDLLTYSATRDTGFSLPSWISFNASTRTFSGVPEQSDVGTLGVRVNVSDSQSKLAFDVFTIEVLSGTAWHNSQKPEDVSGDGNVVPLDALMVINYLNTHTSSEVPPGEDPAAGFVDVNGDNFVTAIDALLVINFLNQGGGEGEFSSTGSVPPPEDFWGEAEEDDELLALLAADARMYS